MYGNVLSASAIERLVFAGDLVIDPFEAQNLGLAHYRVHVGRVYEIRGGNQSHSLNCVFDAESGDGHFVVRPAAFVLVELREHVVLPDGMFARLLPISANIERGLSLAAGKIDAGYGNLLGERQSVIVGVKNNLDVPSMLEEGKGIAQLEITDLRGAEARFGGFSDESIESFAARSARFIRARDDGVSYE